MPHDEIGDDGLWMIVDRDGDRYFPTIVVNSDLVIPLSDPTAAVQYAVAVLRAATYAQYEAATVRQLSAILRGREQPVPPGMAESFLADLIQQMRTKRKAIRDKATAPLRFVPFTGVSAWEPLVGVHLRGRETCQIDASEAQAHAVAVLQATITADLDALYRHVLADILGVPAEITAAMVHQLGDFFNDAPGRPKSDGPSDRKDDV